MTSRSPQFTAHACNFALSTIALVCCLLFAVCCLQTQTQAQEPSIWPAHNRSVTVLRLQTQHHYQEIDTSGLTADGTLNTETGTTQGFALRARWQGNVLGAVPLWLQAAYSHSTGQTDYNGYIQRGTTLSPYRAKTGNARSVQSLRVGVPMAVSEYLALTQPLQIVPYAEQATHNWQRNLVQYGEAYQHKSTNFGLLAQWQFKPALVLELAHQPGRAGAAQVHVPLLGFSATQSAGRSQQSKVTLA